MCAFNKGPGRASVAKNASLGYKYPRPAYLRVPQTGSMAADNGPLWQQQQQRWRQEQTLLLLPAEHGETQDGLLESSRDYTHVSQRAKRSFIRTALVFFVACGLAVTTLLFITGARDANGKRGFRFFFPRDYFQSKAPSPQDAGTSDRSFGGTNPRGDPRKPCVVLYNVTVWSGVSDAPEGKKIVVLHNGTIRFIHDISAFPKIDPDNFNATLPSSFCQCSPNVPCIQPKVHAANMHGLHLTPGLVDMHSHLGLTPWPYSYGADDVNEIQKDEENWIANLNTINAFDPTDNALPLTRAGGVTTFLVLPGSANLIGGEGNAYKSRVLRDRPVKDMTVQARFINKTSGETPEPPHRRWLKMACGENPINVYTSKNAVSTRMGSVLKMQAAFLSALNRKKQQPEQPRGKVPDNLLDLLNDKILLNWHCYMRHDVEASLRVARKFKFKIAAFHHALDLDKALPALKRYETAMKTSVGAAIFADHYGYKREARTGDNMLASRLLAANVMVAFKSDHPVLPSYRLIEQGARAAGMYNLTETQALRAVTTTPAKLMGLGHRLGKVAVGYDGDVVVWNRHPLLPGARPVRVYIDSVLSNYRPDLETQAFLAKTNTQSLDRPKREMGVSKKAETPESFCKSISNIAVPSTDDLTNINVTVSNVLIEGFPYANGNQKKFSIVLHDGAVVCTSNCSGNPAAITFDRDNTVAAPLLVAAGSSLGIIEISQEPGTSGGTIKAPVRSLHNSVPCAADALMAATGRAVREAASEGVGMAIWVPDFEVWQQGFGVFMATSSLFSTLFLQDGVPRILQRNVALHVPLGRRSGAEKTENLASFPDRVLQLESMIHIAQNELALLKNSADDCGDPESARCHLYAVIQGRMVLVLHMDRAEEIVMALALKQRLEERARERIIGKNFDGTEFTGQMRWTFAGAAEAHAVASEIKNVGGCSVLLAPARCAPQDYATQRCLTGYISNMEKSGDTSLVPQHAAHVFLDHGIPVALGTPMHDVNTAQLLRHEVETVRAVLEDGGKVLTSAQALALASDAVLQVFGAKTSASNLLVPAGQKRFAVWSGIPGDLKSRLLFAVEDDKVFMHRRPENGQKGDLAFGNCPDMFIFRSTRDDPYNEDIQ